MAVWVLYTYDPRRGPREIWRGRNSVEYILFRKVMIVKVCQKPEKEEEESIITLVAGLA